MSDKRHDDVPPNHQATLAVEGCRFPQYLVAASQIGRAQRTAPSEALWAHGSPAILASLCWS